MDERLQSNGQFPIPNIMGLTWFWGGMNDSEPSFRVLVNPFGPVAVTPKTLILSSGANLGAKTLRVAQSQAKSQSRTLLLHASATDSGI
jgi:hypothetical protein